MNYSHAYAHTCYQNGVKDGAKLTRFYIIIALIATIAILIIFKTFLNWQSQMEIAKWECEQGIQLNGQVELL